MKSVRFTYAPIETSIKPLRLPQQHISYQFYQYPPNSSQSTAAKIDPNPVVQTISTYRPANFTPQKTQIHFQNRYLSVQKQAMHSSHLQTSSTNFNRSNRRPDLLQSPQVLSSIKDNQTSISLNPITTRKPQAILKRPEPFIPNILNIQTGEFKNVKQSQFKGCCHCFSPVTFNAKNQHSLCE